ncbi:MAG: DUF2938 domain-containing protein [Myxococcaceae bacterium]|nr:DUF2938 domain-containing protein [Myxococcaceae bacterium]
MSESFEVVVRVVLTGVGATVAMDLWALLLRQFGVSSLNYAFLGRWLGHLPRGRWVHERIAAAEPVRGEGVIGWSAHYAIGITFAALLVAVFGESWLRAPTPGPALCIGLATLVAPLFVLQPALGAGIASSKTPTPVLNCFKSAVTHTVYGVGLYLSATAIASLMGPGA